jgi:starvation-inducible DNA-binding protein
MNIGISADNLKFTASVLATLLADEHVLYMKTRNYHWNVTGPSFHALHLFFEQQYDQLGDAIDEVAERIRALGQPAPGTLAEYLRTTRLAEDAEKPASATDMLANLLADHEAIARNLRQEITLVQETYVDTGTADFLTGLLEQHEKMAWMLRAHLS